MQQVALEKAGFATPVTPISSQGMERFATSIEDVFESMLNGDQDFDRMLFSAATELAITSGNLASPTQTLHTVAAETGTTDDLTSIPAVNDSYLLLKAKTGHNIALRSGVSDINVPGTVNLSLSGNKVVLLYCRDGQWSTIGWTQPLANISASRDPGSSDDAAAGYSTDSIWINTTLDRAWVCLDATTGTALWKLITPYINRFGGRSFGATLRAIGCTFTSPGGTASANDDADVYTQSNDSTSGSVAGWAAIVFNQLRLDHNVIAEFYIKTGSDVSSIRYWVGLASADATDVDTLAAGTKFVGFRFSTVAGDAGWRPVLNNGSSQSVGTAIGSVAASTAYKLRIRVDSANAQAYFSVNDSAEQLLATNFPTVTNEMGIIIDVMSQVVGARNILVASFEVGW